MRSSNATPAPSRKVAQLCHQVGETLSFALAGSADGVLRDLAIASVTPAPDASCLLVTIIPPASAATEDDRAALVARLERARGYLRSQVAGAVHRKRVPDLLFALANG